MDAGDTTRSRSGYLRLVGPVLCESVQRVSEDDSVTLKILLDPLSQEQVRKLHAISRVNYVVLRRVLYRLFIAPGNSRLIYLRTPPPPDPDAPYAAMPVRNIIASPTLNDALSVSGPAVLYMLAVSPGK